MKLHQLQNNDLIKIIPFVDKMGNIINSKTSWGIIIPDVKMGNHIYFDQTNLIKNILSNKDEMLSIKFEKIRKHMFKKIYFNVYVNNEFKYITTGKTLNNIISENPNLYDLKSNYLLHINKQEANGYVGLNYKTFDVYDKSKVILDQNFINPFINLDDPYQFIHQNSFDIDIWINWINHHNQTIHTLMNNNNYLNKLKFYDEYNSLIELFELIKKIKRETKLNHILNE